MDQDGERRPVCPALDFDLEIGADTPLTQLDRAGRLNAYDRFFSDC